jgi:hypothetical protein
MPRFLHDHSDVTFRKVDVDDGPGGQTVAHEVYRKSDGPDSLGQVAKSGTSGNGWCYRRTDDYARNPVTGKLPAWTMPYVGATRDDAVDHLISACHPSAPWLT